jgi:hypothetical protein
MTQIANSPSTVPSAPACVLAPDDITCQSLPESAFREAYATVRNELAANADLKVVGVRITYTANHKEATIGYMPWANGVAQLTVSVWNTKKVALAYENIPLAVADVKPVALCGFNAPSFAKIGEQVRESLRAHVFANFVATPYWDEAQRDMISRIVDDITASEIRTNAVLSLIEGARFDLTTGQPRKNDTVEVYKGRKVPIGTIGKVKWIGNNQFGTSVGLEVAGKSGLVFTAVGNVRTMGDESAAVELAKKHYLELGYDKVFGPIRG